MRVVHLSTKDISGGASQAAYRIHQGLRACNIDSTMLTQHRMSDDPDVSVFKPPKNLLRKAQRFTRQKLLQMDFSRYEGTRPSGYPLFSDDRSIFGSTVNRAIPDCDIIHLHWVAGFLDYLELLPIISRRAPVIWTLHDMNVFTGGCHVDWGCGKFSTYCGACPQLGSDNSNDLSARVLQRKKRAFGIVDSESIFIVTNSNWLEKKAQSSSLLMDIPITTIHYGLDTTSFIPRDKSCARAILDIGVDEKVVLFVANSLEARHKGLDLLAQALEGIRDNNNLKLLSVGHGKPSLPGSISHTHLGYIDNTRWLSTIYSAADIFVIPSMQETFGQTALEAMACGTPVVGFSTGGIPEFVHDGVVGRMVPPGDIRQLKAAIFELITNKEILTRFSLNCRQVILKDYTLEVQAKKYLQLYQSILDKIEDK